MRHVSVLLKEAVDLLHLAPGMNVVDCTLGDAGHSEKILELIGPDGKLLGIDADSEAILRAKNFLHEFGDKVVYVRNNFKNLKIILQENNFFPVSGILIDLGWSMPQFQEMGRGFSFQLSEPLDMRYDAIGSVATAADLLNNSDYSGLVKIFSEFGEEKLSKEIARAVVEFRNDNQIQTTDELVQIILKEYRKKLNSKKEIPWIGGVHPATKVFQALRIAVNSELESLKQVLPQAVEVLKKNGRLAVISFHSLEDKMVKHYFKSQNNKTLNIITKKPVICSAEERIANFPSRSAKLRVVEKI
jgi:16S rRNA (cytosine1402-N4)-methyltransferase